MLLCDSEVVREGGFGPKGSGLVKRRRPGASAPTTDCESGCTVRKGGYRIRLGALVTIDDDIHESQNIPHTLTQVVALMEYYPLPSRDWLPDSAGQE
eukprot:1193580-Prorocentrum_minimum.AAC.1